MPNMSNINPIALIVALLAAFIIYDKGKAFYARWQETRRAQASALKSVGDVISNAMALQEKMLDGATRACLAIATETGKHRASVDAFAKLVFKQEAGAEKDKDRDAVQAPSEADKDLFYAEMEHRSAGKTEAEAKALAEEEALAAGATAYPSE